MNRVRKYLMGLSLRYNLAIMVGIVFLVTSMMMGQTMLENDLQIDLKWLALVFAYQLPSTLIITFPICWLISHLIIWKQLSQSSELLSVFSLGIGRREIRNMYLLPIFVISVCLLYLSLYVSPHLLHKGHIILHQHLTNDIFDMFGPGKFMKFENGGTQFFLHAAESKDESLNNIFVALKSKDTNGWNLIKARSITNDKDQHSLLFKHGSMNEFFPKNHQVKRIRFNRYHLAMDVEKSLKNKRPLMMRAVDELISKPTREALMELNWRVFFPLSFIIIAFWSIHIMPRLPSFRSRNQVLTQGLGCYALCIVSFIISQIAISRLSLTSIYWRMMPHAINLIGLGGMTLLRRES